MWSLCCCQFIQLGPALNGTMQRICCHHTFTFTCTAHSVHGPNKSHDKLKLIWRDHHLWCVGHYKYLHNEPTHEQGQHTILSTAQTRRHDAYTVQTQFMCRDTAPKIQFWSNLKFKTAYTYWGDRTEPMNVLLFFVRVFFLFVGGINISFGLLVTDRILLYFMSVCVWVFLFLLFLLFADKFWCGDGVRLVCVRAMHWAHTITWHQNNAMRRSFSSLSLRFLYFIRTRHTNNIRWPISDGSNGLTMSDGKIHCTHKTFGNVVLVAIIQTYTHIHCQFDARTTHEHARNVIFNMGSRPLAVVVQHKCAVRAECATVR